MTRWAQGGKYGAPDGVKKPVGYSFYAGKARQWCFLCSEEHDYHKPTRLEKQDRLAQDPEPAMNKSRFRGGRAA